MRKVSSDFVCSGISEWYPDLRVPGWSASVVMDKCNHILLDVLFRTLENKDRCEAANQNLTQLSLPAWTPLFIKQGS